MEPSELSTTPEERRPARGDLVVDTKSGRLARVMADDFGTQLQLRPPGGGREWDAPADRIRPATTAEAVAEEMRVRGLLSRRETGTAR